MQTWERHVWRILKKHFLGSPNKCNIKDSYFNLLCLRLQARIKAFFHIPRCWHCCLSLSLSLNGATWKIENVNEKVSYWANSSFLVEFEAQSQPPLTAMFVVHTQTHLRQTTKLPSLPLTSCDGKRDFFRMLFAAPCFQEEWMMRCKQKAKLLPRENSGVAEKSLKWSLKQNPTEFLVAMLNTNKIESHDLCSSWRASAGLWDGLAKLWFITFKLPYISSSFFIRQLFCMCLRIPHIQTHTGLSWWFPFFSSSHAKYVISWCALSVADFQTLLPHR